MGAGRGRFLGGGWFLSPPQKKSDIRGERKAWPRATGQIMMTAPASPACRDEEEGASQVLSHRVPSEAGFKVTARLIVVGRDSDHSGCFKPAPVGALGAHGIS